MKTFVFPVDHPTWDYLVAVLCPDGRSACDFVSGGQQLVDATVTRLIQVSTQHERMLTALRDVAHCVDKLGYELPFDVQDAVRAAIPTD